MLLDKFPELKALILDLDGVLWKDTSPIGDLPKIFSIIDDLGLKYIFATNNATKSVDEYVTKLNSLRLNVKPAQIISSSLALGIYLSKKYPDGGKVYIVGQPSLIRTLSEYGFQHEEDPLHRNDILAVIASLDYSLTYEKIKVASLLVQDGTCFYGTNMDVTYPTPQGLWPGSGTIISAIETASQTKAMVVGKPEPLMYEIAMERLNTLPEETMAIGDRFETDIVGGQAANCLTGLVLSGVSSIQDSKRWIPQPNIVCSNLEELLLCRAC
jgi:4-nitrophenyl phosphatase